MRLNQMARKRARLQDLPEVLTIPEAARWLRVGRNTLYEAARRGELPTRRVGRRILLSRAALETWLNP
jgi:excisionase family DNA binding protein